MSYASDEYIGMSWRDIGDFMENCKMRENESLGYTKSGLIPSDKVIYLV